MTNLLTPGNATLAVEVTNISSHGLWLLAHGHEYFLSYDQFPWFRDRTVREILNVAEVAPGHFYWPDLDVDLTAEMIEHPERFPLVANSG
jgi:hypothetical protein